MKNRTRRYLVAAGTGFGLALAGAVLHHVLEQKRIQAANQFLSRCEDAYGKADPNLLRQFLESQGSAMDSTTRAACNGLVYLRWRDDSIRAAPAMAIAHFEALSDPSWDSLAKAGRTTPSKIERPATPWADRERILREMGTCVQLHPSLLECQVTGTLAALDGGKPQAMHAWIDRALENWPHDPFFRDAKAMAHLATGNSSEALRWLSPPTEFPVTPNAREDFRWVATHWGRSTALVSLGRLPEAQRVPDDYSWLPIKGPERPGDTRLKVTQSAASTYLWLGKTDSANKYHDLFDGLRRLQYSMTRVPKYFRRYGTPDPGERRHGTRSLPRGTLHGLRSPNSDSPWKKCHRRRKPTTSESSTPLFTGRRRGIRGMGSTERDHERRCGSLIATEGACRVEGLLAGEDRKGRLHAGIAPNIPTRPRRGRCAAHPARRRKATLRPSGRHADPGHSKWTCFDATPIDPSRRKYRASVRSWWRKRPAVPATRGRNCPARYPAPL